MLIPIHLNATRGGLEAVPLECRRAEARREVKMFVLPRRPAGMMFDSMVPDILVTEDMIDRFLELEPPVASIVPEFQTIIGEIEYAYVVGIFFAAVSASCVTIERLLNLARIELHAHQTPRLKELWNKGPSNSWDENIDALRSWKYLDDDFSSELKSLFSDVRCRYLHSGAITDLAGDALRSTRDAYKLLKIFLGFPEDLFRLAAGGFECLNTSDPRYVALYLPQIQANEMPAGT